MAVRTDEEEVGELLIVQLQEAAFHGAVAVDGVQVREDLVDGARDDARHHRKVAPVRALPVAALQRSRIGASTRARFLSQSCRVRTTVLQSTMVDRLQALSSQAQLPTGRLSARRQSWGNSSSRARTVDSNQRAHDTSAPLA